MKLIKLKYMKLTAKQKDALLTIKQEKSLSKNNCKINNNIMNSLYSKGLVRLPRYANGEFWEITDLGLEAFDVYFDASEDVKPYVKSKKRK